MIFRVDNATLVNLTRHETNLVIGGFTLAAIIIILFGLYLRHASRTVLMNIINAIKTGDVKRAPRLEAMLSKAMKPINSANCPTSARRPSTLSPAAKTAAPSTAILPP